MELVDMVQLVQSKLSHNFTLLLRRLSKTDASLLQH
jgi:hypothetical protein